MTYFLTVFYCDDHVFASVSSLLNNNCDGILRELFSCASCDTAFDTFSFSLCSFCDIFFAVSFYSQQKSHCKCNKCYKLYTERFHLTFELHWKHLNDKHIDVPFCIKLQDNDVYLVFVFAFALSAFFGASGFFSAFFFCPSGNNF